MRRRRRDVDEGEGRVARGKVERREKGMEERRGGKVKGGTARRGARAKADRNVAREERREG